MTTLSLHPDPDAAHFARDRATNACKVAQDCLRAFAFLSDGQRAGTKGLGLVRRASDNIAAVQHYLETK